MSGSPGCSRVSLSAGLVRVGALTAPRVKLAWLQSDSTLLTRPRTRQVSVLPVGSSYAVGTHWMFSVLETEVSLVGPSYTSTSYAVAPPSGSQLSTGVPLTVVASGASPVGPAAAEAGFRAAPRTSTCAVSASARTARVSARR